MGRTVVGVDELDVYEVAYLCGGVERVAQVVLVALLQDGRVKIAPARRVAVLGTSGIGDERLRKILETPDPQLAEWARPKIHVPSRTPNPAPDGRRMLRAARELDRQLERQATIPGMALSTATVPTMAVFSTAMEATAPISSCPSRSGIGRRGGGLRGRPCRGGCSGIRGRCGSGGSGR